MLMYNWYTPFMSLNLYCVKNINNLICFDGIKYFTVIYKNNITFKTL